MNTAITLDSNWRWGRFEKNDHYSLSLSQKSPDDYFAEHIALNIVVVYFVKLCKHSLIITQDGFTLSATMSTAMMETSGTKRYCQYKLSSSSSFLTLELSSLLTLSSLVTKKYCHYQICPDVETCTANCALGNKLAINWIMNYEYQLNYESRI